VTANVAQDLRTAAALDAILWLQTDRAYDDALVRSSVPLCLTGVNPWRPPGLLASRTYAELTIPAPDFPERREMWSSAFPVLDPEVLTDLAARYRMSGGELRAVAAVADAGARLAGTGQPGEHVEPAIATVTRGDHPAPHAGRPGAAGGPAGPDRRDRVGVPRVAAHRGVVGGSPVAPRRVG